MFKTSKKWIAYVKKDALASEIQHVEFSAPALIYNSDELKTLAIIEITKKMGNDWHEPYFVSIKPMPIINSIQNEIFDSIAAEQIAIFGDLLILKSRLDDIISRLRNITPFSSKRGQ